MATRKLERRSRPAAEPRDRAASVFLNIPYDAAFENLLLAYIAGISAFGFTPRATLEIPFGQRRLDRILALIRQSKYSIHDLSRVQLDRNAPRTPRFNMPFELGLTVALERTAHSDHSWIVCETTLRRINKSLSDLDGTDCYVHGGTIGGVFRELGNAFVGSARQPTVKEMAQIYRILRVQFRNVLRRAGANNPFNARVFKELCVLASTAADELIHGVDD
ncbi:MAG: hypothetical protein WA485_22610 [Candidatus Sulfotelmatobacter sp.]